MRKSSRSGSQLRDQARPGDHQRDRTTPVTIAST